MDKISNYAVNTGCSIAVSEVGNALSTMQNSVIQGTNLDIDFIVEQMQFENQNASDNSKRVLFASSLRRVAAVYDNVFSSQSETFKKISDASERIAALEDEIARLEQTSNLLAVQYESLKKIIDNMKPDDEELEANKKRLAEIAKKKLELEMRAADDRTAAAEEAVVVLSLIGSLDTPALRTLVETAMLTLGDVNKAAWNNAKNDDEGDVPELVEKLNEIQDKIRDEQLDDIMEKVSKQTV